MSRKYTTAMGKTIDMAALHAKNEQVRAVGNMSVNARGDTIDSNNHVIDNNSKRVTNMYRKITTNLGAQEQQAVAKVAEQVSKKETIELTEFEKEMLEELNEPNPEKTEVTSKKNKQKK